MGGRMTSLAASKTPLPEVAGLVFFGFPLHPIGKPGTERARDGLDKRVVCAGSGSVAQDQQPLRRLGTNDEGRSLTGSAGGLESYVRQLETTPLDWIGGVGQRFLAARDSPQLLGLFDRRKCLNDIM
jgi:hypothetical protein